MDARDAIETAKSYVDYIFDGEGIRNVGLEEVQFDDPENLWKITIGFTRPWDGPDGRSIAWPEGPSRSYKTVLIDDATGEVRSVLLRTFS